MKKKISANIILPYSVEKMYSLVNDVNSYHLFLPFCSGSRILKLREKYMIASIDVVKFGIKNTFITKNTLHLNKSIKIDLLHGPLIKLKGKWTFIDLKKTCLINFKIEFELFNSFFKKTTKYLLKKITKSIIISFCKRAKEIF